MAVEKIVKGIIEMQFTGLVDRVYAEFVGEVGKHSRTGEAAGSISIMSRSDHYALIGGNNLHLYYLDQGNGRGGSTIYPKKSRALHLKDYDVWAASVKAYKGFHIAKKVADRHR